MTPSFRTSNSQSQRTSGVPSPSTLSRAIRGALLLSAAAGIAVAPSVWAATFTVTSTADDNGSGTLRSAITQANNTVGPDTIVFNASVTGTITLTQGSLYVTDALTITGPGASALTVSGDNVLSTAALSTAATTGINGSVFYISPPFSPSPPVGGISVISGMSVSISGLTIAGGSSSVYGGGIYSHDTNLTVSNCIISGNQARSGGGIAVRGSNSTHAANSLTLVGTAITGNVANNRGGGIFTYETGAINVSTSTISNNGVGRSGGGIYAGNGDAVTIDASTINGNSINAGGGSANGGGITAKYDTLLTIQNSTISGNQATNSNGREYGGGIYVGGDISSSASLVNATITNNTAADGGAGMFTYNTNDEIANTVIANNVGTTGPAVYSSGGTGPGVTVNLTHSFLQANVQVSGTASVNDDGTSQFATDPGLGPLANNGGPTMTQLPLPNSNLIDRGGSNISNAPYDQRGAPNARVVGNSIDIGAVEVQAGGQPPIAATPVPALGNPGKLTLGGLLALAGLLLTRRRRQRN